MPESPASRQPAETGASVRNAIGVMRRSLRQARGRDDLDAARGIIASVGIAVVLWLALGAILGWWF